MVDAINPLGVNRGSEQLLVDSVYLPKTRREEAGVFSSGPSNPRAPKVPGAAATVLGPTSPYRWDEAFV